MKPGDTVLGYDVANANYSSAEFDAYVEAGGSLPDVVLVSALCRR